MEMIKNKINILMRGRWTDGFGAGRGRCGDHQGELPWTIFKAVFDTTFSTSWFRVNLIGTDFYICSSELEQLPLHVTLLAWSLSTASDSAASTASLPNFLLPFRLSAFKTRFHNYGINFNRWSLCMEGKTAQQKNNFSSPVERNKGTIVFIFSMEHFPLFVCVRSVLGMSRHHKKFV